MGDALQFVIQKQLGGHHDESQRVHGAGRRRDEPRVPSGMFLHEEGTDRVGEHEGEEDVGAEGASGRAIHFDGEGDEIDRLGRRRRSPLRRGRFGWIGLRFAVLPLIILLLLLVVLFLLLRIFLLLGHPQTRRVELVPEYAKEAVVKRRLTSRSLSLRLDEPKSRPPLTLPQRYQHPESAGDRHEQRTVLLHQIKQNDQLTPEIHKESPDAQSGQILVPPPEFHVVLEREEFEEQMEGRCEHGHGQQRDVRIGDETTHVVDVGFVESHLPLGFERGREVGEQTPSGRAEASVGHPRR
mmetsp:Transcript_34133/g.102098  ORF Transcript_34133/g.102098 Transcript_34133/m.102098 type:complete len:297 (-) Transcript_34133:52-942(-)